MGKVLSKWRKIENNNDVPLYQIYFPNLHENISKYINQIFSKKSIFASTTASSQYKNLPAFQSASLFKLVHAAFSSFLVLYGVISLSPNYAHALLPWRV